MVHLTMTDAIVAAINLYSKLQPGDERAVELEGDPSLENPAPGLPISHGQIITISKYLQKHAEIQKEGASAHLSHGYHLDRLLRGSRVYVEPPQPKLPKVGPLANRLLEKALTCENADPGVYRIDGPST